MRASDREGHMNAQKYLLTMLDQTDVGMKAKGKRTAVWPVRVRQDDSPHGIGLPAFVWRSHTPRRSSGMDGVSSPSTGIFTVECLSDTSANLVRDDSFTAQGMSANLLDLIQPCLLNVFEDYDEAPDRSQEQVQYYSHILVVELTWECPEH